MCSTGRTFRLKGNGRPNGGMGTEQTESGDAGNGVGPVTPVDVEAGQHQGMVPVTDAQTPLVATEHVQVPLGIALRENLYNTTPTIGVGRYIFVQISRDGTLN